MKKEKLHQAVICLLSFMGIGIIITIVLSFMNFPCSQKELSGNSLKESTNYIAEKDFFSVPDSSRPWVYYWWLKGNVSKELITRDLEQMKEKGIGGLLLFDSRGYHDGYYDGNVPVPLNIKYAFMSPEWREMVKHTMLEANRLGLKMSINLANTGGSLRGPWDMKEDGPKQLTWTEKTIAGPASIVVHLDTPSDKKFFQDVALMAVRIESTGDDSGDKEEPVGLNGKWNEVTESSGNAPVAGEIIDLKDNLIDGTLQWDVPDGEWRILRFAYHVIGDEGSVDILNAEAVKKYFQLMGAELLKDAGPMAGVTLTHFYNVSWEGGQPNWTVEFEEEFEKYCGYDMTRYMPLLTGMTVADDQVSQRFMRDYLSTVSKCFRSNCYETIGKLCHANGIEWHSENGGPWPRNAPMFKEADQLAFWGENDMPQGEFWCSNMDDLTEKSNVRYTAMAAHIYEHPLVAVEAFTHMGLHWTKYPAFLKPFADINFIDGGNFFIWHTFTASPLDVGKPGFEYFAGTHLNPNVTWWDKAGDFLHYLGRCQYMLRSGRFVADVCCYVNDRNYVKWGRGEKWNNESSLVTEPGYAYDLIDAEALVDRLSVQNGRLILPGGMTYEILVIDLDEPKIPKEVLAKIIELVKDGATIVLGKVKPDQTPGLKNYSESDREIAHMAKQLWGEKTGQLRGKMSGKGKIYTGMTMRDVLNEKDILPDFKGPFEYLHRRSDRQDIYFLSGQGNADCTFRVDGMRPEVWDPVSGRVTEAGSYRFTDDGRIIVPIDLPENGSTFIVFREKTDKNHLCSVSGPGNPEIVRYDQNTVTANFWESGNYDFYFSDETASKIAVTVALPVELAGSWNVSFGEEKGISGDITFDKLALWNENSDQSVKYFSGSATYYKSFSLTKTQAGSPARLQLGKVFNIAKVWINGTDAGIVWTSPWTADLTGLIREGTNDLKIEVTNCWANRLIGDAGLAAEKRSTETNVRLVPDRKEYPRAFQAFSAQDTLLPSGLPGPVFIEFGEERMVSF